MSCTEVYLSKPFPHSSILTPTPYPMVSNLPSCGHPISSRGCPKHGVDFDLHTESRRQISEDSFTTASPWHLQDQTTSLALVQASLVLPTSL